MWQRIRMAAGIMGLLVVAAAGVTQAVSVDKLIADAEGRKKAAENGLREIKAKSVQQGEQVRSPYADAVAAQNAWLDMVCQAVQQGTAAAPDVTAATQAAATSLLDWVNVRNRALGLPELTGAIADSTKKAVVENLAELTTVTWKNNRSADERKRTQAATALKDRLHWKTFEEVK
jgi:hypothetical protein